MYLHGFEKHILHDINKRSSQERDGSRQKLGHWIIKYADYLQPIKMVIVSTESCPMFTQWVVFYIVHYIIQSAMMAYISCAMHFGLLSCFCKH